MSSSPLGCGVQDEPPPERIHSGSAQAAPGQAESLSRSVSAGARRLPRARDADGADPAVRFADVSAGPPRGRARVGHRSSFQFAARFVDERRFPRIQYNLVVRALELLRERSGCDRCQGRVGQANSERRRAGRRFERRGGGAANGESRLGDRLADGTAWRAWPPRWAATCRFSSTRRGNLPRPGRAGGAACRRIVPVQSGDRQAAGVAGDRGGISAVSIELSGMRRSTPAARPAAARVAGRRYARGAASMQLGQWMANRLAGGGGSLSTGSSGGGGISPARLCWPISSRAADRPILAFAAMPAAGAAVGLGS